MTFSSFLSIDINCSLCELLDNDNAHNTGHRPELPGSRNIIMKRDGAYFNILLRNIVLCQAASGNWAIFLHEH